MPKKTVVFKKFDLQIPCKVAPSDCLTIYKESEGEIEIRIHDNSTGDSLAVVFGSSEIELLKSFLP